MRSNFDELVIDMIVQHAFDSACHLQGATHSRLVRFVGTGPEANMRFSIHVPSNGKVKVRLAAAHTAENQDIESLTSEWPDWTFTAKVTTFVSEYEF